MNTLYQSLLYLHIAAGSAGILFGTLTLATPPGSRRHRRLGLIFAGSMSLVMLTALPMSLLKWNPFLLLVGVFSGYLVASGWRAGRKRTRRTPDFAIAALMLLAGCIMLWWAYVGETGDWRLVLSVFGLIGIAFSLRDLRALRQPVLAYAPRVSRHMNQMLGAYAASLTAFSATNLLFLPVAVRWLWPTALVVVLGWYYRRTFVDRLPRRPSASAAVRP